MTWRNNYEYGNFNAVCNLFTYGDLSIGVFDQYYHTGNQRNAGVEKNPDKCSGTCGGLDLVPIGGCDFMHIL